MRVRYRNLFFLIAVVSLFTGLALRSETAMNISGTAMAIAGTLAAVGILQSTSDSRNSRKE